MDNSNSGSNCDSGRAVKRRREDDTDRVSNLPEPIIHHILSFLDAKEVVHTSVLSRMWRFAWKHVPVLHFRSDSFQQNSGFERFVEKFLSLRYPYNVRKMTYIDSLDDELSDASEDRERYIGLYVRMIKYALRHNTQHIDIALSYMDEFSGECYRFSELFGTILDSSLESLQLGCVAMDHGFLSSEFRKLTTLDLDVCQLAEDEDGDSDPFSSFPCLKNLVLSHCTHWDSYFCGPGRRLKISGPQLLSLKLVYVCSSEMEIVAPRLKFFEFEHNLYNVKFSELSFPSLDHAVILIDKDDYFMENDMESTRRSLISLFQASSNVGTLMLGSDTIEVLSDMSDFLEQQPSPFTRLKSLIVKADSVPYALTSYFLKGSSTVKPSLEFL